MFGDLLEVFGLQLEETPPPTSWWGYQPAPKPHFLVFCDVISDLMSLLWTTSLGTATWMNTGVAAAICFFAVFALWMRWSLRRRKKRSVALLSADQWERSQLLCHKCCLCKELKKSERHWKPGINESSEDSLEQDIYCMKKKQHNATQVFDKLMFEEAKGALNESKAVNESSFETPFFDHLSCDCCKKTSAHSFGTVTSENLSYMKSRSISYNTSQHDALKGGGKGCLASSESRQTFLKQDLLGMYTSVGTNTSDQFSSEEIWRMTPSVTWTNTEELCITNKYLDDKSLDTSRSSTTWKETEYSNHDSEKYLVSSLDFTKDETTKSSLSENAKKAASQLSTPESSFSNITQTTKTSYSTAPSVKKIPCVNAKKLESLSTLQTPVCSQLTPVSTSVGFDTISCCSSDDCSSFAHYSDAQWSSESPWPVSTSSNTATRNAHFSVTERETSECMSSPSSPTGQTLLASRAITDKLERMPAQNNFTNNSNYSGFQERGLPDSEMKQMESLAFSKLKNQLPLPDTYHSEEKYAKVKSTNFHRHPVVQEIALLTQENVEKFELLQLRKNVQSVLPFVAEKLETTKKSQEITDKDWQRENVVYQTIPSVVPRLDENQIRKLELNVAQMALESQWGLPFIHRKSLSTMMLPLSPLQKKSAEPTVKEVKPPILTESEVYDLEFNLQRRIGIHQWRPTSVKEVNPVDSADVTIVRSEVPTFNERQATCLKLNLGKNVTHKWNGLSQRAAEIQKSPEAPLEDDSVALVEIKAEDVEKSPVYHNQETHFEVKPITNATEDKVENVNKPDALQQQPASAHQSSKTEAELMNESVVQEIDVANGNIEIIQLTKTENMQQLNSGELQMKMDTFTKKNCISETTESKERLPVQPGVSSKASEKEKNYQAIARQGLMTPTPLSILAANTISLANLKNRLISHFQEYPINFEKSARVITPQGASLTTEKDVQIEPTGVESAFIDEKMRNCLEWHITQKKLQYSWDLSSNFERPTEVLISPSPKWIPSQLIDPAVIPTELPFITVEHKKIIEGNVKRKIAGNKLFIKLSLDDMVHAPLQSEDMVRNNSFLKSTDTPYLKIMSHQEKDVKGREKIFLSHDGGIRNGEINKLKELSVTAFQPKEKNRLNICLTKQYVEMKVDRLPDVVMESYEKFYRPAPKKHLPKLITVGKGYKKPRPLYIPFMECNAVDHLEINLKQKLISSLWGSPNLFEKSLETMIPKAPPVPPPIKARAAKIKPIGTETYFIEEKNKNHLERHITQRKLELNWALPTEIQRSRATFMPPAPKLIHSQLKSQYYAHLVIVLTEPSFISNKHKKTLEDNLRKKIISHKRGILPNVVQMSLMNFMNSYSMKDAIAPSEIIKGRKMLAGNLDCYKRTIHHTQTSLLLEYVDNGKGTELNEVVKDKLGMCIRKHCLEIKLNYFPEIVKEMYKVTYSLESKSGLPKLIALGRGYKKSQPHYIPFIEQDLIDRLELNLKHKQISQLWELETLYKKSLEMMISDEQFLLPAIKTIVAKVEPVALKTHFISNHTRLLLEWHIKQKKLQYNWGVPLHILRSQQVFIPAAPKLIVSQLKPQPDFDVNIIPIEPAFLCADSKKKLELNVKKRIINHYWGLPKFVCLSLESFIPHAPSVNSVKPQSGIEENESQVNGKLKTVSLPSTLLRLKGGKLTAPQCEQDIKFVKSSKKRTLPVLAGLKLEHKDKLDMYLIKQCLDIKLNHLPSIVQELYKNTYPSEPKKTLSKFLRAGEDLKKTRPGYIPFFEHDAINKLEMNLKNKHLSHLWGFQTLHEESMEIMIPKAPPVLPAIKANRSQIEAVSMEMAFLGRDARGKLEWHILQKKLQHNWGLPFCYQNSMEAFIPAAPKLIVSQLKPQPDFDVNIIPIEPAFLCAESKKKLELNVKKRIINHHWGLPKFVCLSLESFILRAPSVNSVKPQSGIEENESQVNGKFKTISLPSTLLRLKGGKLTTPQCEQDIKFVKSSKKRTLPVLAGLKLEHKDKLDMYLIKQYLDIKLNHLPSIVQELYKNTYPSKPKKTLSKFLRAGEDLKKTRPGYIPFFEHDAIDKLEMNLKNKHLSHLWGFQTLHEESMEIMIPKAPPVLPAIKANRSQIEAVSMEMAFLDRDARGKLEWHIIQKKLQRNWGLPSSYQNSMEAFIPAAPKLVPSLVNPQVDFHALITPCELSFVDVEISKKLELNIRKKVINQRWGLPKCIQSSLRDFMGPAPLVNVIKSSEAVAHKKNNNIGIRETCRTENPQKQSMQLNGKKLTSAQYKREKRKSKTKSGGKFIFTYLKQEDKDKLDVCLIKQRLEIHMNTLPEMVTNFYKITYPPNSERSFPQLIVPRNGFKKPRASYISFIEQDIVDQLELNLKHKQINHLWGFETPYVESLGMMICSGPPIPPRIKASGAQIEPVSREINFSAEFREDFNMHIMRKKLQQNWDLPLHIQKSESAFIPPAPKLILSKLNPQPDFVIIFSLPELTFLHEEHKRRLEFNVKKKIVNYKWGLPKVVLSSMCNFMAPAPTVKDLIPQHEIIKNKKIIGNTCIEKKSKVLPQDTFPLRIQRKILLPQNERGSHNKKTSNKIVGFSGLKPEHKDKLDICVTKQSLEVKMHCIPKLVTVFYKNTYATPPKKVLPRRIASSEGLKKPRSMYIPFIEQDAVDRLELNLKHKQIIHLWALDTQYEVSIKMIIPEGPNVNPVIRSKGVQIEPVGIEIAFIKVEARNILEWHITQKKLENNWDLPLHIQKSIDMHIPPAPKLVRCQLKQHCFYAAVVKSAEPVFISSEHRKRLELNIKKKIINQKWGLPNLIQLSWKHFMASPPSLQDHIPKSKIMKVQTFPNADVEFNLKMVMRHEKGKLLSLIHEKVSKKANIRKINAFPEFAILEKEYKHKLNTCLLMQVLNTKMHFLPDIVQEYYKNSYPAISKKPLSKPFFVSEGFKKQRPRCLPFVEQDAIDCLELNLKHKLMIHLWKCETLYDESMKVMIPEGPPVSPAIKVSGAKIGPVGMETSCIEYDTRGALDWHITQKKLQQNWGFPLHIQISAELFILPAPKLIPSQLNPKPCFGVIVVSNELEFLSEEHRKLLELNTKKKIINYRWGLPTLIQSSLKIFMGLNGLRNDRMLTMARNAGLSNINIQSKVGIPSHMKKVGTLPLQCKKDSKNTYPSKTRVADIFAILKQENIDKLDVCLRKLHLEIELHCLPEMVKQFYKESYPSKSKKLLKKSIVPGEGCKKPRSLYIAFIEQDAVDRLELNLKHQLIVSLWGLATLYEKSTEMMFARGPPVPPTIKSSGVKIEPTGMETLFIADNVRENLERCVIQKKLQNTWGLPLYVQRSEEAFIPFSPKLILSQLKPQPAFSFVTVPNELAFLHDDHKKVLEINIKKKIINCKWGLPKLIQSSLNSFIAASSDLCSLTNTGNNESKMIPPHTFPKSDCGKLTTLQGNNCDRSKKMENIDDNLFYTSLKPDWKHILETCVIKLCLEIKIGYFPEMVTKFYENTYPSQSKKPLPKLIVFGGGFKKRRQCYLPFIEQDAIDCLELNLKQKNIIHLWEVPTLYDESKEIMNPEGPPVPPTIKGSGALIHPVQLETSFIEDEVKAKLEWHITQKKLQLSFGLPLLIQKSQEAFIPSAPKLIPSQLKVQLDLIYVFVSPELSFLSSEQRKGLELITRKRIINYKWGLPKAVQHSLNNFMPLLSLQSEMMERNELSFCGTQAKNKRAYVPMSTCLQPKSAKVSSKQNQESGGVLKPNNMAERGLSAKLLPECKDKLESCLTKQCLDIKFCFLPEIVYKTYEETFPPISRKPFPKQIEPGKGFKKSRSLYIPFIEQDAVDCLELSLKQKYIMHLWGITTLFKESVALMIPKQPPDPPAIKASGAQIEHVGMETTFIDSEIKERLEWHIVQKKLQHNWGLPLHIQISQEAFIPPAPKLIASQLKPWLRFAVVVVPAELTFLPDGCQKVLELNMKKRIINSKWGLPKSIQLSVRRFIPPAPQMRDVIIQPQKQPMSVRIMPPPAGSILWMKREKLLLPTLQESVKENHEASFANLKIICRDVIDLCLIKQCLEIKMGHLLNLVKDTYKVKYAQGLEKTLTKTILPGQGFKKQRASYMPFIVQETIDRLELNLKHKQIIHLWGLLNPHEESLEMMIPKAPPLPPIIKASGDQIEPVGMETIFIESKTRERLEWQITQKKLQYNWSLPTHIQSSLDAFIPLAPKLILLQLRSKFDFTVVVAPSEIAFLSDEIKHILERNIKKRIINRKWGLPKVIYSSLIQFMPLIPVDKSFILPSKDTNESNITYDNLGKSYEIFSQSTNLRLKGGKLIPQCEKVEMTMRKEKEISSNLHLRPECKHNLNVSLTKQCLETKMDCIPKLVKNLYKITYPLVSKKQLPKIIVPGTGFKRTRINYIPSVEQDAVHRIEMNLKLRQILCLWELETLYEKSMEIMIPEGPPMPPLVKTGRVGIKPVGEATSLFSDEATKLLEWHILQKKLQHTWGSPSYFQKSVEAFIPPAPELILTQLNPQPNFKIEIAPVELAFINNEHKKALEMNTKKRIINHRWGLPKVIESSLNEFMAPHLIKDLVTQLKIKEEYGMWFRTEGLSKNYKMASAQCASHLSKVEKSTLDCEWFKESVRMKTRETFVIVKLSPESKNKLNMCLMKQNVSNKLDCVPDLVTELYQQTYLPVLKKPLAKPITAGKGFKRPRSSYILFAEQDVINCIDVNLKYKQLNNLWGTATPFDMSIEKMIPEGPPLFPAIKATRAKIEHVGMELTFQSAETIDILEWHIETKKLQHHLGIPLHIQRSIDTFIPPPPKLVLSQFNPYPNFDIAVSTNDLTFVNEELKETLETNTNNQIINHSGDPHTSLNNFILPAPPIKKDMQLSRTGERNTAELKRCELSKTDIIVPTDQKSMTRTNCRDFDESSNDNYMEEPFACPNLESKDKEDGGVAEQSLEMQSLDKCTYSDASKHFLNPNTPYTRSKKQNKTKQKKQKRKCCANYLNTDSFMKNNGSSTWISDQKLADSTYKPMTSERLSLSSAIIGENLTSSPLTVQEDLNFYLKQDTNKHFLNPNTAYKRSKKQNKKQKRKCDADNLDIGSVNGSSTWISDQKLADLTYKPMTSERLALSPSIIGENLTSSPLTAQEDLNFYLKQDTNKHFLNLNTPYTRSKKQKGKCYADNLDIDSVNRSSTWISDQKLADLTYKPMTSERLSLSSAIIGENLTSSPLTVREDLNFYLKQITDSVTLSPPGPYVDCEETLSKNARDIGNNESCSERLTEEAKIHIQQAEKHAYVKIITSAIKNQNEVENMQIDLSEMICSQPPPTALHDSLRERMIIASQIPDDGNYLRVSDEELHDVYHENLNKSYHTSKSHIVKKKCRKASQSCYSNQTKPDETLVKPKTKFSRQGCQRPRTFKHEEEGRNSELGNQSTPFVGPSEELQNTAIMTCGSDTDEKEKSLTQETPENYKDNKQSLQSSTLHSLGCQQVLPNEDPPFATNEDSGVHYQCESPFLTHTVH